MRALVPPSAPSARCCKSRSTGERVPSQTLLLSKFFIEPIGNHIHRARHVIALTVLGSAFFRSEDPKRLVLRADCIVQLLCLGHRDLRICCAVQQQERALYFLSHAVQAESLDFPESFLPRLDTAGPEQVIRRDGQRRLLDFLEAPLPGRVIVPDRSPRYACPVARIHRCCAWSVISAQAHRHDGDPARVDVGTRREIVESGAPGYLEVMA